MSKISFTVSVPHEGPHIPQFSISCNNATYLSFKGKDIENARWGNGNTIPKKGWKRLEFGVTGSQVATRFSLLVNTSVILPPLAWSTPGPAPAASVARGGSTPMKRDLEDGAKLLRDRGNGRQSLRIEDGNREWEDRGQTRRPDREDLSRPGRGERVRRSDRRRRQEHDMKHFDVFEDAIDGQAGSSMERPGLQHDRPQRRRRRERRKSNVGNSDEEYWTRESKQRSQRRESFDELRLGRRRGSTGISETSTGSRVIGKKINPKYRNPSRRNSLTDYDNGMDDHIYRKAEGTTKKHHEDVKQHYRRSQRRESLRPVDFGYQPDVESGGVFVD